MYAAGRKSPAAELEDVLVANSRLIVSQQTVFINRKSALLVIAVLGRPVELQEFADSLRAVKGVTHGSFSIVSDM
jgi:metal-responsive CopG/Arc/MetJ family transcriptional regulator